MARGNEILINGTEPKGRMIEGIVKTANTFYPGQIVQIDASTSLVNGRHTYEVYNRDADGNRPLGPYVVVLSNQNLGKTTSDSYAAGERFFGYCPLPGDELNLLISNVSGTATISKGTLLIVDDGTGEMIVTTGSPESEPAVLLEDITDNAADQLGWCLWTGY